MFHINYLKQISSFATDLSSNGYWAANDVFQKEQLNIIENEYSRNINDFKPAQIGKGEFKSNNSLIRNDMNFWLDNNNKNLTPIWELIESLTNIIRSELFLPIKRHETQFALYPPGHFYKRHVDKHKFMPSRLLTMVYYISPWKEENSGELIVYSKEPVKIEPRQNSLVLFLSELEHEVLPTKVNRKSLTTWFRDDVL